MPTLLCPNCQQPVAQVANQIYYCARCQRNLLDRPHTKAYAGAEWLQKALGADKPLSPLGRNVADLLGELFKGIYHLDTGHLLETQWDRDDILKVHIAYVDWSTYDFDLLTRLVFLAHHRALRVELRPTAKSHLRLFFSQRQRRGSFFTEHPRLSEAVRDFEAEVVLAEHHDDAPVLAEA